MYRQLFEKSGLTLDRLHSLVLLRQKGSLIKAAEGDAVRQSQMSRNLKELASFFESDLVEKVGKTLTLTPEGTELARIAEGCFTELLRFRDNSKNVPRTVIVAAEPAFLASLIAPVIGRLRRSQKIARFELLALNREDIIARLLDQKLAVGIFSETAVPRNLQTREIIRQSYAVIVPTRLSPSGGMLTWQRALSECPFAINASDKRLISGLEKMFHAAKMEFRPSLLCSSLEECVSAVRSGYFASILPPWILSSIEGTTAELVEAAELDVLSGKVLAVWDKRYFTIHPYLAGIPSLLRELLES